MLIMKDFEQGTPEWFQARLGIPTSSNFDKIITTTGKPSKQSEKYMYQLAGERITKSPTEGYKSDFMERGKVLEAEARMFYEMLYDVEVQQVGIVYKDEDKKTACSPDGLTEGGLEIKCPAIHTHVSYMINEGNLVKDYFQQVQGSLYVTGLEWWDLLSYYPGMKPVLVRVIPDALFISQLSLEIAVFCKQLDALTDKLK